MKSEKRKNMRNTGCDPQGSGVDINRNYGYKWGHDQIGSSSDPCDDSFRGAESAFSEPEI